jgi:DNA-binding transcriptional LysR family regulator
MTQPAVSHALRRLRDSMGDELFVREGRRMKPTPKAESLMPMVRAGLEQFSRVLAGGREFDPATSDRIFRIAMSDYAEYLLMPETIVRVRRAAPWVRLQVRRPDALFVPPEDDLQRGKLDAALGFFADPRGLSGALFQEVILTEQNVLVGQRGNPALRKPMTFEHFASLPQAAVIAGSDARGFIDREMSARGKPRKLAYATPNFFSALRAVSQTKLVAVLPEGLVKRFAQEWNLEWTRVPLQLPEFTLRLVWHRALHDDSDHRWFREVLLAVGRDIA